MQRTTKFGLVFKAGHTIEKVYVETDCFCPNCGIRKAWVEDDPGDVYLGPTYVCLSCSCAFTLSMTLNGAGWGYPYAQIIEKIRAEINEL